MLMMQLVSPYHLPTDFSPHWEKELEAPSFLSPVPPPCRQLNTTTPRLGVRHVTMETETSVPGGESCYQNSAGNQQMFPHSVRKTSCVLWGNTEMYFTFF